MKWFTADLHFAHPFVDTLRMHRSNNRPNMSISRSRTVLTGGSMMPTSSEASTRMLARKTNSTSWETSVPAARGA